MRDTKLTEVQTLALRWVAEYPMRARPQELGHTILDRPGYIEPRPHRKGVRRPLKPQAAHRLGMHALRNLERKGLVKVGLWRDGHWQDGQSHYGASLTEAGKAKLAELCNPK